MSAALEIRALEAGYGRTPVLQGLDLEVPGGVTAILGSSGCGKTTLLRAVAGFVRPTAGSITVAGTPVVGAGRTVPARRRGIGYVPQEGALFPHLTVARNVAFGLERSARRGVDARVSEALELVELDPELASRLPHQLSGGQQQRVALARALAPRPRLVLLDEPFSSLDAGLREETGRAVVRALRAAGAAAVLVTHDQGEALSLADQVAVMRQGRFLQVADPTTVYLSPADPGVAAFIGHATLLPGVVTGAGRAQCVLGEVALRADGGAAGGDVRLAVRSEQLQIVPADSPAGVAGEVVDVSFFGHDATIRVRLAGSGSGSGSGSASGAGGDDGDLVAARTPADSVPRTGDRIRLSVVGEVVAFPA